MKSKKAQAGTISPFVMAIIGAAIVLAIGLIVMGEFKSTTVGMIDATSYTNVTETITNGTSSTIGTCISDEDLTVTTLYNDTATAVTISSGNYTISGNTITLSSDVIGSADVTSRNITYSCKEPSSAYTATSTNITKLATVPTWIGILITVALAFIVLGYFYGRQ